MLNELEQLAGKIARVLRHADALAAENQRLRAEVERLQAEAEASKTERDAMAAEIDAVERQAAELREEADRLPYSPAIEAELERMMREDPFMTERR